MNIGIVGSRQFADHALMLRLIDSLITRYGEFTLVSGGAAGADSIATESYDAWSCEAMTPIPRHIVHRLDSPDAYAAFGPDFRSRAFGRNGWIVRDSGLIFAFFVTPDRTGGTLNTYNQALRAGVPVYSHFPWGWEPPLDRI